MLPNELDFNSYKLSTRIWLFTYKLTGRKARNALEKACEMMWEVEAEQTRGLADVMALHEQTFGETGISVTLSLSSGETAIQDVNDATDKAEFYSLSGQRVAKPSHGIYIKNNKKVKL